jgi:hypothetical protein
MFNFQCMLCCHGTGGFNEISPILPGLVMAANNSYILLIDRKYFPITYSLNQQLFLFIAYLSYQINRLKEFVLEHFRLACSSKFKT